MTIKFRCEHCHKEVNAPDTAAGKRGKCPYCGQGSYIPAPVSDEDVLPLAPIDEEEERRRQEEIHALLKQERELIAESKGEPPVPLEHREDLDTEDLHHFVVNYCLDMGGGRLDRAQAHVQKLKSFGQKGIGAVNDFITGRAGEPALKNIPRPVLMGFLKQLSERLR